MRHRSRLINILGLLLFLAGCAALLGSLVLRGALASFEIQALVIEAQLQGIQPAAACRIEGHNPLPLPVTIDDIEVDIGGGPLPVELHFDSDQALVFEPGAFTQRLPLTGETASMDLTRASGALIDLLKQGTRALDAVPYEASARVGIGPLKRTCRFEGTASATLDKAPR